MANKKTGFMPIYRSLLEHWMWTSDEPFDIRSAWIDLLLSVNHEDHKLNVGRDVITIHAGQMWTSYVKLAQRWHWDRKRVYRYIKMLKNDGMIYTDGTPNGTLLTLVNYDSFALRGNTNGTTDGATEGTSRGTTEGATGGTQTINIENVNNIKNERKDPAPPRGGGEWQ